MTRDNILMATGTVFLAVSATCAVIVAVCLVLAAVTSCARAYRTRRKFRRALKTWTPPTKEDYQRQRELFVRVHRAIAELNRPRTPWD